MSGGSFHYLYRKYIINPEYVSALRKMLDRVEGWTKPGSDRVTEILRTHLSVVETCKSTADQSHAQIEHILKAVEWHASCDRRWATVLEAADIDADSLAAQWVDNGVMGAPEGVRRLEFSDGSAVVRTDRGWKVEDSD